MTTVSADRLAGVRSGLAIKAPVLCATTANITLEGVQTIDGVTVAANSRVLVKNQDDATENGIYNSTANAWQRAGDCDGTGDIVQGTLVSVVRGATQAGIWEVSTASPVIGAALDFALTYLDTSVPGGASTIGYLPSGTGAVATTVQAKLWEFPQTGDYSTNDDYLAAVAANATAGWYVSEGGKIDRFPGRLFVGHAGTDYAGGPSPDAGTGWLGSSADGPHYLLSNATLLAMPDQRRYGIVGAVSTGHSTIGAGSAIGIGAIAINDASGVNAAPAWAFIIEVQHETTDAKTWGIEIAVKNASGASTTLTPFSTSPTNMTTGLLLSGGGDDAFGPSATHACTAGIVFSTNNSKGWNTGIVFRTSSIPTGEAIALPQSYVMNWYENGGTISGTIRCTNNTASTKMTLSLGSNSLSVLNNAGNSAFFVSSPSTAVNRIQVTANTTGNAPFISAEGADTNIDLHLVPKGTGNVRFGTHAAIAAETVTGYITIKDSAGTLRKIAVVS